MCPIVDGMAVDATNTNAQKLDKISDDSAVGIIELANTVAASGSTVTNIQREHNSIASFVGKTLNAIKNVLPSWTHNEVGASSDDLFTRANLLTAEFNGTTGHTHDGTNGNGPTIPSGNIGSVQLKGSVVQGTDLTGVTGTSTVVTTQLTGSTPSTGNTVQGVVVTNPYNKIVLRQATGTNQDDEFVDGSGNVVYGRLTYAASVWTLSYYVNLAGTETAYSFSSSDVRWYYQQLFNPITNAPVYSEYALIPSDNVTADVITATTTKQGKTQLSNSTPAVIASTGSAGTANATVANADHAHAGVHSVAKSGSTALLGDVTLTGSSGTTLTQVSQNIDVSSPALSTNAPAAVGSAASAGSGTASSKDDHVHVGVHSVAKSGSSALVGDVTFTGTGATTLTQSGQNIQISSTGGSTSPLTTKGDVWGYSTLDARIPIGSDTQVLTADSTQTLGLKWATPFISPLTTKGDILSHSTVDARLGVGSDGQVVTADSTQTLGIKWATPSTSSARAINTQSGTTYTFALTDGSGNGNNPLVTFGSASATTITVPTNASVAFPVGTQIDCLQLGAGKVTFAAAGGVTLSSQSSNLSVAAQYVGVSLLKTATNTWILFGNLIA